MDIHSPLEKEVPTCKENMRKLRKKIYKYTCSHETARKPKDSVRDILALLKTRDIPPALIDQLKKRRNFEIGNFKSLVMPEKLDLTEINIRRADQEK